MAPRPEAVELYQGGFLHGLHARAREFEDWAERERARLWRLATEAGRSAAVTALLEGRALEAIRLAHWVVALEPWDETVMRDVVLVLRGAGNRADAVAAYAAFDKRLQRERGVRPCRERRDLFDTYVLSPRGDWQVGAGPDEGQRDPGRYA